MTKLADISHITIWASITLLTITLLSIPRISKLQKTGFIASMYIIFGKNFTKSIKFVLGCLTLTITPNNKLFCSISRTLFNDLTLIENTHRLKNCKGKIIICNYPDFNMIEYFTQGLLPQNYALVINKKSASLLKKAYPEDRLILLDLEKGKDNYDVLKNAIRDKIDKGYNIFTYFDTHHDKTGKKERYSLNGVRYGIFNIAKDLDVGVIPVVMDHLYISTGCIVKQNFEIRVLDESGIKSDCDVDTILKTYRKILKGFMTKKFCFVKSKI